MWLSVIIQPIVLLALVHFLLLVCYHLYKLIRFPNSVAVGPKLNLTLACKHSSCKGEDPQHYRSSSSAESNVIMLTLLSKFVHGV